MPKVDVHNKGERTYTAPSGASLAAGQTVQLEKAEAETLMASYPRDLISPDSLRSSPASQSTKDLRTEIERLQGLVEAEKAKVATLETEKSALTAKVEAFEKAALEAKNSEPAKVPPVVPGPTPPATPGTPAT